MWKLEIDAIEDLESRRSSSALPDRILWLAVNIHRYPIRQIPHPPDTHTNGDIVDAAMGVEVPEPGRYNE
jgi:hypothetical protein